MGMISIEYPSLQSNSFQAPSDFVSVISSWCMRIRVGGLADIPSTLLSIIGDSYQILHW